MSEIMVMATVTAFIGFICTIFVLVKIIQDISNRLTKTNEQLMIMLTTNNGNEAGARGIVASAKLPLVGGSGMVKAKKETVEETKEEKPGVRLTVGSM